jgi:hypothetical protein
MTDDLESGAAPVVPAKDAAAKSGQNKTAGAAPLSLTDALKLGGVAYAIGFGVIMVHTARLNGPVVEAFQFQNIIAGLPVWAPLWVVIWLWPRLIRPMEEEDATRPGGIRFAVSNFAMVIAGIGVAVSVALVYAELRWMFGLRFSTRGNVLLISVILFAAVISMLLSAYQHEKAAKLRALFKLMAMCSGVAVLVLAYAIFGYPSLPQSVGGGHPVQVKLYLKDHGLSPLLGGEATPGEKAFASDPVYLYYRTGSYLLISKLENQPVIQVPTDQVLAVVWLESRAQ